MRFKHIYNMYRFIAGIRLLYAKFVKNLHVYAGQNFSFCFAENQHMNSNFLLFLIYNPQSLPDLGKKELRKTVSRNEYRSTFIRNLYEILCKSHATICICRADRKFFCLLALASCL